MTTFNKEKFLAELAHFTGTQYYYKAPMFKGLCFSYTEGVKFLAQESKCYWLLDFIFSHQILDKLKYCNFQVWTITCRNGKVTISVRDCDDEHICDYPICYSDFPLDEMTLYLINNILLLPSEC